ncbi:MAG: right-handed parallel beta-helix repeat-containing protein, partial [Candidatus Cloacimonetes bacterium]|nr:right-handed parallel beta-helix repeat-containing protein [Candidatus Cloacimonadota bacterium]
MKYKILFFIILTIIIINCFPADSLFAQTITSITTSDSLITDFDVGLDNFTVTITFNEAVDTTKVTEINFDPVISSTLKDSTPSWSSDSTNFYMNYDIEDNNVEIDSIDIYVQYAQTISDTLFDAFSIDTMNPTDTVFISDFSDPIDTGGHLNIEFYKNEAKGSGYFRLYYTEGYTIWPGNSSATIIDSIASPYDLSTLDETDYLVRIYWLDDAGNLSPNFAQAGPMQSIDNSNVYVGTLNTYEFGTLTYPYDTIQEGINNVLNGGTVNVENKTYSDSVIVNKSLYIKGIASSVYYIDGDVTLDAKPITITDALLQPPHSWYITENASIQNGVDAASHGDSIKVKDGTYTENININKTINFSSVNGYDSTTIAASYTLEHVIKITADSVTFNGFSVYGAEKPLDYKAGIYLNSVENCNITNNRFGYYYSNQNDYGISIINSNNNIIENNICSYNNFIGIYSENSNNNEIINNICCNNLNYGMFITSNNYNSFVENICNGNDVGIHLLLSNFCCLIGNIAKYNDFNGINIRYYSDNNFIYDNTFKENDDTGIKISFSSKNNVLNNNLSELNMNGLHITESSDKNTITNNSFTNNNNHGIVIDNSDNNILIKNLSDSNTDYGLNIISSDNNNIYMNTFSNNSFPVNSNSSINNWNSPTEISYEFNDYSYHKKFLGNFYGNYSGFDLDEDGIGDSPYNLPGSEPNDNYPLILSSDKYILQAWWLSADSIMYKDSLGNPLHEVTIPGTQSNMWISDQPINSNLNFSTNDTWTGQILFATPLQSGITFSFEVGYSTTGENFVFCGPDTTIVGDGSTMQFTYKTDGSNYFMPAGSYYALKISNNAGSNYNVVTGGGSTYISGPVYSPELFLNPSDSLNFGKVDKTNINDSTLTILAKNIGKTELIIDSLLSLEPPFSVNFPTPDTIQVGDSIFIPITLEREFDVGMYIDTLYIFDNCNNSSIIITAQLTEPTVSVIPDTINFGIQAISDEKDSLSFVIKNLGSSKLIIDGFSELTFPFNISYELPDTVYPDIGDSSEIFISFDRSTPGYFIDTLWIYNNDIDTSIVVIGELAQPIISIDPNYIDFGTTSATNQSDSLSFKIKNCGTGNLIIDGLNGLSLPFNISCSIPDTILPSDSSEIYIILDMSIAGSYIDTLLISNN